ncbi:MAG TPA: phage holin family protein, partial [Ilumatobacteraceae bacterium]|nr:phage holin family protein [Ilumatobacteraceae bacterium]
MSSETRTLRPAAQRPTAAQLVGRTLSITVVVAVALMITSWLLPNFEIARFRDALLAGLVMGLFNALVWPALAVVLVPLSVYTLGLANLAVNALLTWLVLGDLPGVRLDSFWAALLVALIATVIATLLATA